MYRMYKLFNEITNKIDKTDKTDNTLFETNMLKKYVANSNDYIYRDIQTRLDIIFEKCLNNLIYQVYVVIRCSMASTIYFDANYDSKINGYDKCCIITIVVNTIDKKQSLQENLVNNYGFVSSDISDNKCIELPPYVLKKFDTTEFNKSIVKDFIQLDLTNYVFKTNNIFLLNLYEKKSASLINEKTITNIKNVILERAKYGHTHYKYPIKYAKYVLNYLVKKEIFNDLKISASYEHIIISWDN